MLFLSQLHPEVQDGRKIPQFGLLKTSLDKSFFPDLFFLMRIIYESPHFAPPSLPAVFILLDRAVVHHLWFTRRRGECATQASRVFVSFSGWLTFSREDRVDLMRSASRTSPGLGRQEVLLQAAAAVRRR